MKIHYFASIYFWMVGEMKLIALSLIFSFLLSSCSNIIVNAERDRPIAAADTSEIAFYLSIDKFKYYLNEYSVAQEGKIPDEVIAFLRKVSVEELLKLELNGMALKDANRYDDLIYKLLQDNNLTQGLPKEKFAWGYNFFKTKLNEAFNLAPSKLDIKLTVESTSTDINKGLELKPQDLAPEDMTLDSGHYISNRTTRAIFWEANENNRPIEFHLGDSREFLKELKDKNGQLLYEIKPFAKNYNKIYIVQYPGEDTYRYSITNIGGQDRLDHLSHQISLSNFSGKKLSPKVIVKGDIKKFHAAKAEEHALQLRLLPRADRVIIGQKESIDGKFNLFWKVQALKNLYDSEPPLFQEKTAKLTPKEKEKLSA
ncbi:MAG: hypothetical protein K2Q18_11695, partial [Bdellovibrionales bacterium]|nr:hypothetical protein [Bdellovibrionales bacterium]